MDSSSSDRISLNSGRLGYQWNEKSVEHTETCVLCGKTFADSETLDSHMRNSHVGTDRLTGSTDPGSCSMINGVYRLWDDFRSEHQLPPVVFLMGDRYVRARTLRRINRDGSVMPVYYRGRFRSDIDGTMIDAIVLTDRWLHLDIDARCSTLAHLAAHVENDLALEIYDISFRRVGLHDPQFKRTAKTYDLYVAGAPRMGGAITLITDEFRRKHRDAISMIRKGVPLTDVGGTILARNCGM